MTQLPHWTLTNVFPSLESPELAAAFEAMQAQLTDLQTYLDTHGIRAPYTPDPATDYGAVLDPLLEKMNTLIRQFATVQAYVSSFITTDSFNAVVKRNFSKVQLLGVQFSQLNVRIEGWMGQIREHLPAAMASHPLAAQHAFVLHETAEQSRYLMSEAEEGLAAELGLSGAQAWTKLHGTLTSQLTVQFERDGKTETLPVTAVQNIAHHDPDEATRRRAHEAEVAAWHSIREPLAAAMNGVKGTQLTLAKRRGRPSVLHASLETSRIDEATLNALLEAMRASFPTFHRYFKAKARRLGKETLAWWDLFAPVGASHAADRHFTWPEATAFIAAQFGAFSPELAAFAQHAFDNHWVDAEPRAGKRGGAFCMNVPGVSESRVLMNFDGSLDSVFTLAHELGHAYHNHCLRHQPMLLRETPMTLAETASIFCETIVTEAALAAAASPAEALNILETSLIGSGQVIVDITSRFLFEQRVLERRASGDLTADDLCALMLECQSETYGDGLHPDHRHPYMWAWKPHYYYSGFAFYNYPYAFGQLFGLGLYALYQQRGPAFVADYTQLLASTGTAPAAELAARFGINIRETGFWANSLAVIAKQIEKYESL